jgi:hypothetical protein
MKSMKESGGKERKTKQKVKQKGENKLKEINKKKKKIKEKEIKKCMENECRNRVGSNFFFLLHGLSPRANYTDRATAASRRSGCQLLRIKGATGSA